ncbi:MAG TPA: SPOR domain-containing protein [Allosphingosinicella sp.]|nr:SPOR domain-containing protein [Allosphingosinicella sp.]
MTDARTTDIDDGDRLPWLEAVEDESGGEGPSALKLIAAVVIGLLAIGLVVGGLFWLGNRGGTAGADGEAELIEAPDGPYRVAPDTPGGMQVEGQGGTAHKASEGQQPQGNLSMVVPETPVGRDGAGRPPAQQPAQQPGAGQQQPGGQAKAPPAPAQQPARPGAAPAPAPAPAAASGPAIQLGAFSSQASAEGAWRAMAARFRYLAPLSHSVTPVQANGRTLYRLRASGAGSADVCRRLQVAGESCVAVR